MSGRFRFITAVLTAGFIAMAVMVGASQHEAQKLLGAWQVTTIDGAHVPDGVDVTMTFGADGRVAGRGGCNRYSGSYAPTGDGLRIGPVAMTRMACPDPAMAVEGRFAAALDRATHSAQDSDGQLILHSAEGAVLIVAKAMP